jgi:ssDNA-binding Zn-finger/Zn-ribbon topoisomerase 1/DNA-binding MarR family transcriptional regulator
VILSSSSQKALAALWRLADGAGRVSVARRADLLKASRVSRGSWDRAIKGLVEAGLVVVEERPANRRSPRCYMLVARDRATTSHETSHDESPLDLLLSSSKQGTKEESLEEETREDRATSEPRNEPRESDLAAAVWALVAAFERIATALETRQASEPKAAVSEERPGASTESAAGPRCACGPMVVWPNPATKEQFWGCAKGPKDRGGCGAPTILLRASASSASRPRCPDCGGPTHLNRPKDRVTFWGCDRYPACKGKVSIEDAAQPLPCEVRHSPAAPAKRSQFAGLRVMEDTRPIKQRAARFSVSSVASAVTELLGQSAR